MGRTALLALSCCGIRACGDGYSSRSRISDESEAKSDIAFCEGMGLPSS